MVQNLVLFFGRNPELSLAEALFFFNDLGEKFSFSCFQQEVGFFAFENEQNASALVDSLGGTAKIASVLFELASFSSKEIVKRLDSLGFFNFLPEKFFYYSDVFCEGSVEKCQDLLSALKGKFKQLGAKAMFKHPKPFKERALATMGPGELRRWGLINDGFELLVFEKDKKFLVCRTVAATNTVAIEDRDSKRPVQAPTKAVSIRLARMLLNLAGCRPGRTVLDPFCGIGTIVQEALINGANAIGIELDPGEAASAEKNLEWFFKNQKPKGVWRIINSDSTKLSSVLKRGEFDCVATEPYLGPLVHTVLPEAIVKKQILELEQLYSAVFFELAKLMKPGQRVVFILPSIPATSGKKISAGEKVFLQAGFKIINPAGTTVFPYSYMQKESKILRKIFVLEKN